MTEMFLLEIVKHDTGEVTESVRGTAFSLANLLQDILEHLPEGVGVTINYDGE